MICKQFIIQKNLCKRRVQVVLTRTTSGVERRSRDDLVSSKQSSERALATRAQSRGGKLSLQMLQVGTRNCDGKIKLGTEITLNSFEILLSILYFAWNLCRLTLCKLDAFRCQSGAQIVIILNTTLIRVFKTINNNVL